MMLIHILIVTGAVWFVFQKTPPERKLRIHLFLSLGLKLGAGLLLGWFYREVKGGGDTIGFYEEALLLADWAGTDFSAYLKFLAGARELPFDSLYDNAPRAQYISKWVSVIFLAGPSPYWLASIWFSLFAWTGLWMLALSLYNKFGKQWAAIAFSLLYFPSVVFWSSGLTKESMAAGAIGFLLAGLLSLEKSRDIVRKAGGIIVVLVMFLVLWKVKYYYAGVLLISLLTGYILFSPRVRLSIWYRVSLFAVALLVGWFLISQLNPNLNPASLPAVIYDQYVIFVEKSLPGRYVEFGTLCPAWDCVLLTFPFAAAAGLYLPLPFNAWSSWVLLAGLENVLLIALSVTWLMSLKVKRQGVSSWTVSGWIYCLILAGFLAMSAPNLGTLVRYRVGFLPVLLLLITMNNGYFYRIKRFITQSISKQRI